MKFREIDTAAASGAILAHSAATASGRIPKGTVLDEPLLSALRAAGVGRVTVAFPEAGDVAEDEAAGRIASALAGGNVRAGAPLSGRANLYAACKGLFRADAAQVDALNAVDSAVTLATLSDHAHVEKGRLVATVKIIPFAMPEKAVKACERLAGILEVGEYVGAVARLIQTRLSGTRESVLDKTRRVTEARLAQCAATLGGEDRCAHRTAELAAAMSAALESGPDLLLVSGASAVSDPHDVIPAAIERLGGEVRRVGMPVDPGNLLVLGRIGSAAVLGLPGCARSPKLNGLDWVLRRLCAGECVASEDVLRMGVGGLLDEIYERPRLRIPAAAAPARPLAAVLLAGGLSSRMEGRNKLLEEWKGKPLLLHSAEALAQARGKGEIDAAVVVTGSDNERIEALCAGLGLTLVHNPGFRSGMASSLAAGIRAVPAGTAGAFVCLGDMPLAAAGRLAGLAAAFSPGEGRDIVVPVWGGKRGHPVLFGARHFEGLCALEGDVGARPLLGRHEDAVVQVEAGPEALLDFDDPAAFAAET